MTNINEARAALEKELQAITNLPVQPIVERMIDLVTCIRVELRKNEKDTHS
jgi:glutamyl-tRNA reductase